MYYFRFEIGLNSDGTRISYSPYWYGTIDLCPKGKVDVLLYNDKEGYGIAKCEDTYIPKEVTVLSEAEALKIVNDTPNTAQVYKGTKLTDVFYMEVSKVVSAKKVVENGR